jgi:hypothetical protein
MGHIFDSYFLCDDSLRPVGFAYQQSDPAGVNSGAVKIICAAVTDGAQCSTSSGSADDGRLTISTDWSTDGMVGCPISASGGQRVVIVVVAPGSFGANGVLVSAIGILVSLSGAIPGLEYAVEAAHPFDPVSDQVLPPACGQTIQLLGGAGRTVALRAALPPVYTDCDPDSLGAQILGTCTDDFRPVLSYGPIYTRAQPCGDPIDPRTDGWTNTGVMPDASGYATVTAGPFPPDQCLFVGSTTILNGIETGIVTGFVKPDIDCIDGDGDGYTTCDGDCDDRDATVHLGATEICDGRDNDCDGQVDEGLDGDLDGIADCSDNCPTIPNADQNICACAECRVLDLTISFSSSYGKGSGVVTWNTGPEVDFAGFNIVAYDQQGRRTQLNPVLIPCEECVTGIGHTYTYVIPKHKSGRNLFVETVRRNGTILVFGPAQKI